MMNHNKRKLIISSLITLLPILVGLILWQELPPSIATHWGADGNADGWSSRFSAVFFPPLLMLAVHWILIFFIGKDPNNNQQHRKVFNLLYWMIPMISLAANGTIYAVALGNAFNPLLLVQLLMGIMFVGLGNYMPKCKRNYTLGIRIKWTLGNEANWNATHRFAGKIWVAGGILILLSIFLPVAVALWVSLPVILATAFIPCIYSWCYYRKQVKEGAGALTPIHTSKKVRLLSIISIVAALLLVAVLMFTGSIEVSYGDTAMTISMTYWNDMTIDYEAIESVEYRDHDAPGSRIMGYGSARLLGGSFSNEEFGSYTRFSYTACDACVVLKVSGNTLVLSGPDVQSTQDIYQQILSRTALPQE